jgi:ubiquinone/menaquinone biosynthesis C-methylase UbiE
MDEQVSPFGDAHIAASYEDWYVGAGRRAARLEKALLSKLLTDFAGARSALEVGCGTGHFTRWLERRGLQVTGVDTSPAMLAQARRRGSATCVLGDALALPFAPLTFDIAFLITTLEFVARPLHALSEAVRVARRGVIVGVLNRHSLLGWHRRHSSAPVWQAAQQLTVRQHVQLLRQAAGSRAAEVHWRTTLWPLPGLGALPLPWGGFIGLALKLRETDRGDRS